MADAVPAGNYCEFVRLPASHPLHREYHDTEYGFPQTDESVLFERLTLEVFQAGLSWEIILKRRAGLQRAFQGFEVNAVAEFSDSKIEELLQNPEIIRNRKKVEATIFNAQRVQKMREEGGFSEWLLTQARTDLDGWVKRFRQEFKFTGREVVNSFMMSISLLPGAHEPECEVNERIRERIRSMNWPTLH